MATEYDIIENAPDYASEVAHLADWSQNYDAPTPFGLFLDIIGWSDEHLGEPAFDLRQCATKIGYLEIGMLAEALTQYHAAPNDVTEWVDKLMNADGRDEEAEAS